MNNSLDEVERVMTKAEQHGAKTHVRLDWIRLILNVCIWTAIAAITFGVNRAGFPGDSLL
jgi:hypothetical protein